MKTTMYPRGGIGASLMFYALTLLVAPSLVQAQSSNIMTSTASETSLVSRSCFTFERNLGIGVGIREPEADFLRVVLVKEGVWNTSDDIGVYDEEVAAAVVRLQAKYAISQTGYFGPITRGRINVLYGCGSARNIPYVTSVTSPISVGSKMTIKGFRLNDLSTFSMPTVFVDGSPVKGVDGSKDGTLLFFVIPSFTNGQHTVYVKNNNGVSNKVSFTVIGGSTYSQTITQPSGDSMWTMGTQETVKWTNASQQDPHIPKIIVVLSRPDGSEKMNITDQKEGYFPYLGLYPTSSDFAGVKVNVPQLATAAGNYGIFQIILAAADTTPDDLNDNKILSDRVLVTLVKGPETLPPLINTTKREQIRALYLKLQHREPEQQGWDYWTDHTGSIDEIRQLMMQGVEYQTKQKIISIFQECGKGYPSDLDITKWYYTVEYFNYNTDYVRRALNCSSSFTTPVPVSITTPVTSSVPQAGDYVTESIKCVFKGSNQEEKCTSEGGVYTFSGVGTAGGVIRGINNSKITWKSSCGGYGHTFLDGQDEYVGFTCERVVSGPTITSVNTYSVTGATELAVYGSNFGADSKVYIDGMTGTLLTPYNIDPSGTKANVKLPQLSSEIHTVLVYTNGRGSNKVEFKVQQPTVTTPSVTNTDRREAIRQLYLTLQRRELDQGGLGLLGKFWYVSRSDKINNDFWYRV